MIDCEHFLETVLGDAPPRIHDAGVVDQYVKLAVLCEEYVGKLPDLLERAEIRAQELDVLACASTADPGDRVESAGLVAPE